MKSFLFGPIILFTVIIVGFERNFTSVDESIGSFELCVGIFTEVRFLPAMFEFSLDLFTATNTAGSYIVNPCALG